MRKMLLLSFIILFFASCSSMPKPKSYINTSAPIFILKKPKNNHVHIEFEDRSHKENDILGAISSKLAQNGFVVVQDKDQASVLIKGAIYYLKQETRRNTRGYMGVGFGFGSKGWRSREVELGMSHRIFSNGTWNDFGSGDYRYDGQASLLIRIKVGENFENYTTNLNFLTEENTHSLNYARKLFNEQIASQILSYLKP